MTISDEILVSYVDGALPDDQAREVEAAVATSPAMLRDLVAMMRADKLAGAYFHAIDERPLPAGVIAALEKLPTGEAPGNGEEESEKETGNVVPLGGRRPAMAQGATRRAAWHLPLAASIALAIGLGAGIGLGPAPAGGGSALIAKGQPLYDVLESGISGRTVALDSAMRRYATPLMTASAGGVYCREFEVAAPEAITWGAACRQGDSTWLVAVQTAEPTESIDGTFQPASEKRPAAIETFFATAAPLDTDAEQALIANKWTAK